MFEFKTQPKSDHGSEPYGIGTNKLWHELFGSYPLDMTILLIFPDIVD